jgi:AraC-like DNA-binding protein
MNQIKIYAYSLLIGFMFFGCDVQSSDKMADGVRASQNNRTVLDYLMYSSHQPDAVETNLRIITITLIFFFLFLLFFNNRSQPAGKLLMVLLLIPVLNHLSFVFNHYINSLIWIRIGINSLIFTYPFLFLLLVQTLFIDTFKLNRKHLTGYGTFIVIDLLLINTIGFTGQVREQLLFDVIYRLLVVLLFSLTLIAEAYCVFQIIKDWRSDLIEKRRRFRMITLLIFIVYDVNWMVGEVFNQLFQFKYHSYYQTVTEAFVLLLLASRLLKTDQAFFETFYFRTAVSKKQNNKNENQPLLTLLNKLMEEDKFYRIENQSVSNLAGKLKMQEYKLRRLINQQMGYRNFNDFINHYRIEEARILLKTTDMQILNISMEVGYGSIASFNRIFKNLTNITPSQYRKEHIN